MPPSLEAAVDELYCAFARPKPPKAIDHCSHCISAARVKQLLAPVPLREVPVEAFLSYTMSAADTVGGASDFRYFLPRILDIALTGGFGGYPDLKFILCRFVHDHFGRAGAEYWLTARNLSDTAFATVQTWLGGPHLTEVVAAAADTVTDEQTRDVLLEILTLL
jgi:hypothetical protein